MESKLRDNLLRACWLILAEKKQVEMPGTGIPLDPFQCPRLEVDGSSPNWTLRADGFWLDTPVYRNGLQIPDDTILLNLVNRLPFPEVPNLFAFWTDHTAEGNWPDSYPRSCEVSALHVGRPFISIGGGLVLRCLGTERECRDAMILLQEIGWDAWLAEWRPLKGSP